MSKRDKKKSNEIEIYRSLRKRIELSSPQDRVISVISNDSGDGKTELVYKLGQSFARAGKKTLLIDGNLRNPDLSINLAKESNNHLEMILKNDVDLDSAISKSDEGNLYVLPSRKSVDNSTEILENDGIKYILEVAKKDFDYIIIDTLSLNQGIDGIVLGKLSDGIVYITVENKSKSKTLEKYNTILKESDLKIIGAIYRKG